MANIDNVLSSLKKYGIVVKHIMLYQYASDVPQFEAKLNCNYLAWIEKLQTNNLISKNDVLGEWANLFGSEKLVKKVS